MRKTLLMTALIGSLSFAGAQGTTPDINSPAYPGWVTLAPAVRDTPNLDAAGHFNLAQELAAAAEVAYPTAFVDRTLWYNALANAYLAHAMMPDVREYQVFLAALYTKTNWWANAYNEWKALGNLSPQEADVAAFTAAKLAYINFRQNDPIAARMYLAQALQWAQNPALRDQLTDLGERL